MTTTLGDPPQADPLYTYFQNEILPQLGVFISNARWKANRFHVSRDVILYEEKNTGVRLVGKFFKSADMAEARRTADVEFDNLLYLRSIGYDRPPHYVVRPLGFHPGFGNLLVMEYAGGEPLSAVITSAMVHGRRDRLYRKLTALGHFFASLHNQTAGEGGIPFDDIRHSMTWFLTFLQERWGLSAREAVKFEALSELWRGRACMWEDRPVLVHGDATPSNLLLGGGRDVTAIDLERMRRADRVYDLGRLCGELKHFFFRHTGNVWAAEPFIGHFLWEYCRHFPDQRAAFAAVTRRLPFYMAVTLLRIARNSWVDGDYRRRLINEAKQILRNG